MTSTLHSQFVQTPSKVVHIRNLPWDCSEQELIEVCQPFGSVKNTRCNVGSNRNQAFVEFADVNQAMSMVSYYLSSSEPAQIRGRNVYVQYSNRQEIINGKTVGDASGNVLLVTFEGIAAGDVSIDVFHVVFSAFGFVQKITTFEKTAGFQALVQYADSTVASAAKNALDGRSIPRYLLPKNVQICQLRISFSAHKDLQVKFQSDRSRDYTNPNVPVAPSAMTGIAQDFNIGPGLRTPEVESNVLLASVENMAYAVTIDVLSTVFSAFGRVQKIVIPEKMAGFQALVQYPDIPTAVRAKEALEGHCIYEGGFCKLHLAYSHHVDLTVKGSAERSHDCTSSNISGPASISGQRPAFVASPFKGPSGSDFFCSPSVPYSASRFPSDCIASAPGGLPAGSNNYPVQGPSHFQGATAPVTPNSAFSSSTAVGARMPGGGAFNYQGPVSNFWFSAPRCIPGQNPLSMSDSRATSATPVQYGNGNSLSHFSPNNPCFEMFQRT